MEMKRYGRNVMRGSGTKGDKAQCMKRYLAAEFKNFEGQWVSFSYVG